MKRSRGRVSRREFLNTGLVGATTLAGAPWTWMAAAPGDRARVRGTCMHDCPDTCAWIVTTENGKAVALQDDSNHATEP